MPIIQVKNNKHKYARSDWITPGLIQSIKFRDNLYKKLKKINLTNPIYNTRANELKSYNKILRNCITSTKSTYYSNEFNKYTNDMKKTGNVINSVLGKKKMKSLFPPKLETSKLS